MVKDYPPLSDFTLAFAREYKAFMVANGIKGYQIAEKLGRNESYVSVRANGKRAIDMEDIDALAMLAGWSGEALMLELARRARDAGHAGGTDSDAELASVHYPTFATKQSFDERAVASEVSDDDGYDTNYED